MAAAKFTFRKVKFGIRCTAKVTLSCGHTLEERATGRTEVIAQGVAARLLHIQTTAHAKLCKD